MKVKEIAFTCYPVSDMPRARAFYEGVLQAALRQFFRRASLEIEPGATVGADRTLAIDSSSS